MESGQAGVRIGWAWIFADVPFPLAERAQAYWQTVTGAVAGPPEGDREQFVPLRPASGDTVMYVQAVDRDEPGWHLDLATEDLDAATRRAVDLGARPVRETADVVVLASPAGLAFCLVRTSAAFAVPPSGRWPGGRSEVDQLCLDVPADDFEREATFWAGLTSRPRRPGTRPEFEHLPRPDGMAVRILLQRLGADDPHGARMHADLAADDRVAETARHVAAGGRVERVAAEWTVLRDPAGLVYCITDRSPRA